MLSLLLSVDCRKIVVKLWKWLGNEISIVEYFGIIRGENLIAGKIGRKIFDVHRTPISMLIHRYATSYATPLHDSVVAILLLWLYKYLLWLSAQINNTYKYLTWNYDGKTISSIVSSIIFFYLFRRNYGLRKIASIRFLFYFSICRLWQIMFQKTNKKLFKNTK